MEKLTGGNMPDMREFSRVLIALQMEKFYKITNGVVDEYTRSSIERAYKAANELNKDDIVASINITVLKTPDNDAFQISTSVVGDLDMLMAMSMLVAADIQERGESVELTETGPSTVQ
jgi:hypothetical protein